MMATARVRALAAWPRTIKPVIALFLVSAAAGAHFMGTYGVVIDPTMMVNVLQTNATETRDLISLRLVMSLLLIAALPIALMSSGATVESCVAAARREGYAYAGLQWQGQCYAGNTLGYAKVPQQDEHKPGKCDTRCTANQADWCGGGWHNSIYKTR